MLIIPSTDFDTVTGDKAEWVYNGLDCCLTQEIAGKLLAELASNNQASRIYSFEMDLHGPALEMSWRGFLVDRAERARMILVYEDIAEKILWKFHKCCEALGLPAVNPNSPQQMLDLFYHYLGLPEIISSKKGVQKLSADREALEKLAAYIQARPFCVLALAYRDVAKTLQWLKAGVDEDGRFRSAYNPAGTETGRWSSSKNPFGTGGNGQNITNDLRHILIADQGYKLCNIDLEQAESRGVGAYSYYVTGRSAYLDACESGDLHTTVASMIWSHIKTRADADQPFYRHWSYRDMAKRAGHGTNYLGTPATMAKHLKVEKKLLVDFQDAYFRPFPEIRAWHDWTSLTLQTEGALTTLFGRTRHFFGRARDPATLREAIAFQPQSALVDLLDEGLLTAWRHPDLRPLQFLAQVHDAIVFQYKEEDEARLLPKVQECLRIPLIVEPRAKAPVREVYVPCEISVGWNWRKPDSRNPHHADADGLRKWKGSDNRKRSRPAQVAPGDWRLA